MCSSSPRSESAAWGPDFLGGDSILELSHLGPGPALPLMRGISDITVDSDGAHGMEVDMPTARWTPNSAGLWPVSYPMNPCCVDPDPLLGMNPSLFTRE